MIKAIIKESEEINSDGKIIRSKEFIYRGKNFDDLSKIPVGKKAEKIKLKIEFEGKDIDNLIKFLKNCKSCFEK